MSLYSSFSDDYYVNVNLNTEMDLPSGRESTLHFFEQLRKKYPTMCNFYNRERGEYVLEEEKEAGHYRWATVEPRRIYSGYYNPQNIEDALEQHGVAMELVPYALSISPLDCESISLMFGFDFTYRGNHNALLAEAIGIAPALERFTEIEGTSLLSNEPMFVLGLDEECRTQCRLSFETRTTPYHVRSGEFPEEQLSVYLTIRRFGSLEPGDTYVDALETLKGHCTKLLDNYVVENILVPLQQAIAIK